ncbi:MAG: YdcF family protein [Pseudomonadota bacterium]
MRRFFRAVIVIAVVVYGPLLYLRATTEITTADETESAQAVLVFGALVRQGQISALHAERLDTAADLLRRGMVQKIVVSNAARAAEVMRDYLVENGVEPSAIELDPNAPATPDTCVTELGRATPRPVMLLSQSFHLPRISYQCANLGLTGQYVAAASAGGPSEIGTLRTLWIRAWRHTREALLIWAEMLGVYRTLS